MKIDKHTVASVTYALDVDGQKVEETGKDKPLTFLVGTGSMIPGFEQELLGKQTGDSYEMTIPPEQAYGEVDPNAVVDLSKDIFKVEGQVQEDLLQVGKVVPMQDQNGNPLQGVVKDVGDETVTMDFNHQLAGKTLHFTGEVLEVREATPDEISHGHAHGPGGHQH
ncbi:MAG: FKBP-type peptidyl-prolyl cis-trans isomerase [Candidatus Cyclobacteriaceae bacterium M3_2C_046]